MLSLALLLIGRFGDFLFVRLSGFLPFTISKRKEIHRLYHAFKVSYR